MKIEKILLTSLLDQPTLSIEIRKKIIAFMDSQKKQLTYPAFLKQLVVDSRLGLQEFKLLAYELHLRKAHDLLLEILTCLNKEKQIDKAAVVAMLFQNERLEVESRMPSRPYNMISYKRDCSIVSYETNSRKRKMPDEESTQVDSNAGVTSSKKHCRNPTIATPAILQSPITVMFPSQSSAPTLFSSSPLKVSYSKKILSEAALEAKFHKKSPENAALDEALEMFFNSFTLGSATACWGKYPIVQQFFLHPESVINSDQLNRKRYAILLKALIYAHTYRALTKQLYSIPASLSVISSQEIQTLKETLEAYPRKFHENVFLKIKEALNMASVSSEQPRMTYGEK